MGRNVVVFGIHAEVPDHWLFNNDESPLNGEFSTSLRCVSSIEPIEKDNALFSAVASAEWTRRWRELENIPPLQPRKDFEMDHARSQAYHWQDIYAKAMLAEEKQILERVAK